MTTPTPGKIVKDQWLTVQVELLDTEIRAEFGDAQQRVVAVLLQETKTRDATRVVYGVNDPNNPGQIIPVDFDDAFTGIDNRKGQRVQKPDVQEPNTYPIGKGYGKPSDVNSRRANK